MSDIQNTFVDDVDRRLAQLACSAVLDPTPHELARIQAELLALAGALAASHFPGLLSIAELIGTATAHISEARHVQDLMAAVDASWGMWKVHGELAGGAVTVASATGAADVVDDPEPVALDAADFPLDEEELAEVEAFAAASVVADEATPVAAPVEEPAPVAYAVDGPVADDEDLEILRTDPELTGMFIGEAIDHLGTIEATVLHLEANPDDQKLLNDVFRPFHTIKGNAGALGVKSVQEFAHKVENLLDLGRSGKIRIGPAECDAILKSVDLLSTMINDLTPRLGGQPAVDVRAVKAELMTVVDNLANPGRAPMAVPVAAPQPAAADRQAAADRAMVGAGPAVEGPAAPVPATRAGDGPQNRRSEDALASVKVDTRKLDNLVDMVGELVIVQSIINADPALVGVADERLSRNLAQLKRITSDLQRNAMSMRMVPIRQTFQKMARLVRDLSKKSGKQIDLVLQGEDTELDRKVVEDINDPLMHMVRNSIDHGIEMAERRAKAGKSPTGRLSLSAYHQGGNIVIAIEDDGAGLDADRILAKALEKGVVKAGENLAPADIYQLIFKPGFSTAEKVTEISGRGVGMDVVRRNIEALRGRVEIQTQLGSGTTFYIKLPLTLAIVEGLLLRVGDQRFVLPTFSIRESLRPVAEQVHAVQGQPRMIKVREQLVPLVQLGELFGVSKAVTNVCEATAVVIEDDGRPVALLVDQLLGKQEVVIKSLGEAFSHVRGVAGGAILGDGRIGLILDAGGIVALMGRGKAEAA